MRHDKHILMLLCVLLAGLWLAPCAEVQGANVIRTAKESIKKRQKLPDTAKALLEEAAKVETTNRDRAECYRLAAECHRQIHLQENTKLYLHQAYDTALFFSSLLEMFRLSEQADSVAMQPDERGRTPHVKLRRSRDYLQPYRQNLLNGGKWQLMHHRPADAFRYFDTYIHLADTPPFAADSLLKTDPQMPQVAYLATYMAHEAQMSDAVVRHSPLAKRAEGQQVEFIQEYLCRAYQTKGDTLEMIVNLREGLHEWPQHEFFFSRLLDHYALTGQFKAGLAVADSMLTVDEKKPLYWYARSLFLLKLHEDSKAIVACDRCIELDSTYVDAHYNKGIAALNLAVAYARTACTDITNPQCQRDLEVLRSLYQMARTPMETVRRLQPDATDRWAAPLYRIYLNLNMGREFDEMDRLLK